METVNTKGLFIEVRQPSIAVSSTCFKERDLGRLLQHVRSEGFTDLELSGNIAYKAAPAVRGMLRKYRDVFRLQIHNYFPAPRCPFVLNMGHPDTALRTLRHCKKAVELCADLGIRYYSVHAGMAFNPSPFDLGESQLHIKAFDFSESRKLMINGIVELAVYADRRGIGLLIENNVIADYNTVSGKNERYHFADSREAEIFASLFRHPNIGILLDVGHLKVSARTMGFDPVEFIGFCRDRIKAVHLSDNDGTEDQNLPFSEDAWFWSCVPWSGLEYVSLELDPGYAGLLHGQRKLVADKLPALTN
jgi:sugar phosphate isomerase/epimerase